jgi:hypothetical protein
MPEILEIKATGNDLWVRIGPVDTHQQARYYSNRYGKSDHDCFVVSIKEDTEGKFWVYIYKKEIIPGAVEEL